MKTITLFRAYQRAASRRESINGDYHGHYGIAVNKDDIARRWQKYDRIARRLEQRILERLGEGYTYPTCARCGYHFAACGCQEFQPHIPDSPMSLVRELANTLDSDDAIELAQLATDGLCARCGREVPLGHVLCKGCAIEEVHNWGFE